MLLAGALLLVRSALTFATDCFRQQQPTNRDSQLQSARADEMSAASSSQAAAAMASEDRAPASIGGGHTDSTRADLEVSYGTLVSLARLSELVH